MVLKDLMKNIGGVFSRMSADITRRPDGGTSHYRPLRKKTAEPQPGEMNQGQGEPQDPQFVHTGFTGMNPPAYYGGYDQQTAYGQTSFGNTSWAGPYDQQAGAQTSGSRTRRRRSMWARAASAPRPDSRKRDGTAISPICPA